MRGLKLPAGSKVLVGPLSYKEDANQIGSHVRKLLGTNHRVVLSSEVVSGQAEADATVRVVVRMGSGTMAREAAEQLHGRAFEFGYSESPLGGGLKLGVKVMYQSRLRTSRGVWGAVGGEVERLKREVWGRFVRVGIFQEGGEGDRGHVAVTVGGCDRAAVCDAKRRIAGIMAGEVVASPGAGGVPLWSDRLLTAEGVRVLRGIQTETGAYVHYDVHKRQLAAYGTPAARIAARERLLAHLGALPPPPPPAPAEEAGEGECPVCLTEPTDAVIIPTCGHAYCADCLSAFLASTPSTRSFPITCITCRSPLPLSVIPATLHTAAWSNHVLTHPAELTSARRPTAPACSPQRPTRRATSRSAAKWRLASEFEAERLFGEWAAGRDVKRCTGVGCGAVIEKVDGCNHVQCQRCFVHMCWVCGGLFSRAGVYVHMRKEHGGIGLGDDEDEFEQVPAEWVPAVGGEEGQGQWVGGDGW
ncbi:uncharacterized protein LAJ45_04830 [Morchella importuna]|uniref:uncharacterized protein n=1 Tax=Morchella importuna TaxID=1174673 RepID=UPI001E8D5234|nr:uncharacterized protein LAJ45_04830 [Morchella importuna]KAH8151128.1 hypothetical protein LAJ45_04830 [Morchella importuna]